MMSCSDEARATFTKFSGQTLIKDDVGKPTTQVKTESASEEEQDGEKTSTVDHPLGIVIKREIIEVDTAYDCLMEDAVIQRKNSGNEDSEAGTNGHSLSLPDGSLVKSEEDEEADTDVIEQEEMEKEQHFMKVIDTKKQSFKKHVKIRLHKNKAGNTCSVWQGF